MYSGVAVTAIIINLAPRLNARRCDDEKDGIVYNLATPSPLRVIKKRARNFQEVLEALPDGILIVDKWEKV